MRLLFMKRSVSASAVYPVPSQYDPDELLEFICDQFISRMEGVLVAQRGKLISPDYKLTNMKNDIGKILCGRGTYRSKLLPHYIPGILSSTIISEQWLNFVNEYIIQPHVKNHKRHRPNVGHPSRDDNSSHSEIENRRLRTKPVSAEPRRNV